MASLEENPAITGEPGPGGTCRVCGSKLAEGSLHCGWCGATYGEGNRCPHCRAVADVEETPEGFRCKVCGGPRIPLADPGVVKSGREVPLLQKAQRLRMRGAAWTLGAIFAGSAALLALLLAVAVLAIASAGIVGTAATGVVVAVPFVIAWLAWARARAAKRERASAVEEAWTMVASDVLRDREKELSAAELARALRVSEPRAEVLLARLNLEDFVRARVTDAGDLVYSAADVTARLRVPDEATAEPETAAPDASRPDARRAP